MLTTKRRTPESADYLVRANFVFECVGGGVVAVLVEHFGDLKCCGDADVGVGVCEARPDGVFEPSLYQHPASKADSKAVAVVAGDGVLWISV
jgi:hypothetical protein